MSNTAKVVDCNGIPVRIGTKVKIVRLLKRLLACLPIEEFEVVSQMIGKIFEVNEIDEYGGAWVEMLFGENGDEFHTHRVSLDASEMEVVNEP